MVFVPYQPTGTIHSRKTNALVMLLDGMYDTSYACLPFSSLWPDDAPIDVSLANPSILSVTQEVSTAISAVTLSPSTTA